MTILKEFLKIIEEKGKYVVFSLIGVVVLLLAILFWQFFQNEPKNMTTDMDVYEELLGEEMEENEEDSADSEDISMEAKGSEHAEIVVDVKGAVNHPGVYTLKTNSRVVDAIEQAGGLAEGGEQNAINFAQVLEDQMVIYVPEIGEEGVDLAHLDQNIGGEEADGISKININVSEKEALMTLNGIGSSKADSILAYREENGNFETIEDIKNVSGIGEATFENLKEFITVDP